MTDRHPGAFMLSLTLHLAAAGVLWLVNYAANQSQQETTKVFEMVAGPGDNFLATEAPAGSEASSIKADLPPAPPQSRPEPPKPVEVQPTPTPPKQSTPKPPPTIAQKIERKVEAAEAKTKAQLAKEHEAERKRVTKDDFDKQNPNNTRKVASATPPKVPKVTTDGLKGVAGGTGKQPGAGGTALTRPDGPVMDAYFSMLKERLRTALEKPPGLSDSLVTVIEVHVNADGSLTGAHIKKSSGSAEFDQAALAAVNATRMPERPDKKSELVAIPFRMKELDDGL